MNASKGFTHTALALAVAAPMQIIDYSDDIDPELLYQGIEEEEEEEEVDLDDDGSDEDRGDDVDPDLPPDEDDDDDDGDDDDQDPDEGDPDEDDIDPDDLAELAGDGKSKMVPHKRFNEVNESLKAERQARLLLEEELARTKGQVPAKEKPADKDEPTPFDFDAAEDRYNNAILEGDAEQAKAIRREIRAEERKEARAEAEQHANATYEQRRAQDDQQRAQAAMLTVAAESYKKYPFLNSEGDEPDDDAIEMVLALRNKHIRAGVDPAEALRKAVAKVGPMYSEDGAEESEEDKPVSKSKRAIIERNLERDKKIPPRAQGSGERGRSLDYASLTEEEFDKLSDEDKRKARGDFIS